MPNYNYEREEAMMINPKHSTRCAACWAHWKRDMDWYGVNLDDGLRRVMDMPRCLKHYEAAGGNRQHWYLWDGTLRAAQLLRDADEDDDLAFEVYVPLRAPPLRRSKRDARPSLRMLEGANWAYTQCVFNNLTRYMLKLTGGDEC